MYAKLFLAVLALAAIFLLAEGLPGLVATAKDVLPAKSHSSQYNLIFWLMLLIGLFALLKPPRRNRP